MLLSSLIYASNRCKAPIQLKRSFKEVFDEVKILYKKYKETTSPSKKIEIEKALIFLNDYLASELSGYFKGALASSSKEERRLAYSRRHSCARDLLSAFSSFRRPLPQENFQSEENNSA